MSDAAITTRWTARLAVRRALLKAALATKNKAKIALRERQVSEAMRVLARHRGATGVSPHGAQFIATFEGGASAGGMFKPYRDAVGVWTIGYGHTSGVSSRSKPLTHAQAVALLRKDLDRVYAPPVLQLAKNIGMKLQQHELDALVSFVYNLGTGAIGPDWTMGRTLRARNRLATIDAFKLYDKAGGRTLPGLTRRRHAEARLYKTGSYATS